MSNKDKWVRRFSVDETSRHKNGFTIYKITSVLFPLSSPEAVTVVSVWKRYSDVQQLHKSMRRLHAGLHLGGTFPELVRFSYFKRFQQQVIEERAKLIKSLLEFVAEHKLLFTSTDFVNFLQTGYPAPTPTTSTINAIRSSLQLPLEDSPPLEYQTDDDDRSTADHTANQNQSRDETDFISQIPIFEPADVEMPKLKQMFKADSFDSLNSLDSISSDLYSELDKVQVEAKPSVKKNVLPDLINFDVPSTSVFDDYHTMNQAENSYHTANQENSVCDSESVSLNSYSRSNSRVSVNKSVLSLSNVENKMKTEDSYVFEAGYMLNLAARYEDMKEYQRAFECYKSGIEKMLIGVQSDTDASRRALIKQKTNKYLSYAEAVYKNHLAGSERSRPPSPFARTPCPLPLSMLRGPYEALSLYRVVAVLGPRVMLVLHKGEQTCYAMKVIQKIPKNLTEFDDYFTQNSSDTRQLILPTVIPYMVPLHSYIETNNLIFLILSYAPGEKLFDYIKNYAKSVPNTPAREVNLENIFVEPKKIIDEENNIEVKTEEIVLKTNLKTEFEVELENETEISIVDRIEQNINKLESIENIENKNVKTDSIDNLEISVNDLVINSQKLLLNVDKALKEEPKIGEEEKEKIDRDVKGKIEKVEEVEVKTGGQMVPVVESRVQTPVLHKLAPPLRRDVLPPSAVCRWGAEILTALESLHNCGVICRDLNPSNILLGANGQSILTYFVGEPSDVSRSRLIASSMTSNVTSYVAPELMVGVGEEGDERVADFWSFGAVMYELICGVPLSHNHPTFSTHTLLYLPSGLPLEARELLTQLLTYEPSERLGSGKDGIEEIKRHPYFRHVNWQEVKDGWVVPD